MTYRFWSPSDDDRLRKLWSVDRKTQPAIAAILGRTPNSVAGRISYLKLRTAVHKTYFQWTPVTRFKLRKLWPTEASIATIASALGVTSRMVIRQSAKMRLRDRARIIVHREKKMRKPLATTEKSEKGWHKGKLRDLPPEPNPAHGMFFLPRNKCQWIANKYVPNSGDRQKCGEQVVAGRPYCPGHEARVWRPREEKQAA